MYQLEQYLEMMTDRHRTLALEVAIRRAVRAGDVVLESLTETRSPALSDEGLLAREILANANGTATVRQLAQRPTSAFSNRFASAEDALPVLVKVLQRYAAQ